jgi:hypothetical protein
LMPSTVLMVTKLVNWKQEFFSARNQTHNDRHFWVLYVSKWTRTDRLRAYRFCDHFGFVSAFQFFNDFPSFSSNPYIFDSINIYLMLLRCTLIETLQKRIKLFRERSQDDVMELRSFMTDLRSEIW